MEKNVPITKQVANFISNDKQTNSFGRIKKREHKTEHCPCRYPKFTLGLFFIFFTFQYSN